MLNRLLRDLPEDFVVDTAWLHGQGLSASSLRDYVARGWLERVGPRLYRRPGRDEPGKVRWETAVLSLQTLVDVPVHVGGITALELSGYWHYAPAGRRKVWLYSDAPAARALLGRLDLDAEVEFRSRKLFDEPELGLETRPLDLVSSTLGTPLHPAPSHGNARRQEMRVSGPERAILEVLDRIPAEIGFDHGEHLFEGLTTLRPRVLQSLLESCRSVKAKRLFLYFAQAKKHPWARKLETDGLDLGTGKRQIVPGGELDRTFQITVPRGKAL